MTIYVIIRVCEMHNGLEPWGPPVSLHFTKKHAEKRLKEWQREHSWDEYRYEIIPMRVLGKPCDFVKFLFAIVEVCPKNREGGLDCGPGIDYCTTEDRAQRRIETWKECHPGDTQQYSIREMEVRGERRKENLYTDCKRETDSVPSVDLTDMKN